MNLLIKATQNTPELVFDEALNKWIISGRSYPKDPTLVYEPVLNWLAAHKQSQPEMCSFDFMFEFFNTSSFKMLFDIVMSLKKMKEHSKTSLAIKWYYEDSDEDMKENGESLMTMSGLTFEMVSYSV